MDTPEAIGERIREIRRQRGITQEGLAEAVGVSRSAVAQWETGRAGQVTGNLTRVADVLGVHVAVLLGANPRGAPPSKLSAEEMALLRLFRDAGAKDRQELLRAARRMGKAAEGAARTKARAASPKATAKAPGRPRGKAPAKATAKPAAKAPAKAKARIAGKARAGRPAKGRK